KKLDEIFVKIGKKNSFNVNSYCFSASPHTLRSQIQTFTGKNSSNRQDEALNFEISDTYKVIDAIQTEISEDTAKFLLLIAENSVKDEFVRETRTISSINYYPQFYVAPLVEAEILLSPEQKKNGCLLIDFGAGCTSFALYANNYPCLCAVVPLGSKHITADIEKKFNLRFEAAEKVKCTLGLAMEKDVKVEKQIIKTVDFQNVISARLNEILNFIAKEIKYQGFYASVKEIAITGGGSQLKKLSEFISNFFDGKDVDFVKFDNNILPEMDFSKTLLYSLLKKCDENHEKKKEVIETVENTKKRTKKEKNTLGGIAKKFWGNSLFNEENETRFEDEANSQNTENK
ncbi:MAG: hypothetical protein LBB53_05040, partial [Prevotellaceae bacterium]|nr:hypothetical protein [Prevotellaceae bacterium]